MANSRMLNFLLLAGTVVLLSLTVISFLKIVSSKTPDFAVFYGAGLDLTVEKNVYQDKSLFTAFNYPPQTAVMYLPFLLFPYRVAQGLFAALTLCLIPVCVWLSLRILRDTLSWQRLLFLTNIAVLAFPIKFTLGMGQSNILALFLFLTSFFFYQQQRKTVVGILLAIAVIVKPILLFVGLFYLFRRQWKTLGIFAITILLFSVIPLALQGVSIYQYYLSTQIPEVIKSSGLAVYYNQSLMGALSRLPLSMTQAHILYLAGVVCILWGTFRTLLSKEENDAFLLSRLFLALLLLNILSWQHHFAFLLFPFMTLGSRLWKSGQRRKQLLFFIALVLVSLNIKDPKMFTYSPLSVVLSHGFFGAFLLWILFLPLSKKKKY